jgi:penicillin-binding protein 2
MVLREQLDSELWRARIVLAAMLLALLGLTGVLWGVQVRQAPEFRSSLDRQSVRRVRLPAVRGAILDRNGQCLADNRPSYCMAVYVEELRRPGRIERTIENVERVVAALAAVLELPVEIDRDAIDRHLRMQRPLPLLVWRDMGPDALARWAESDTAFPGVDIYVEPVRVYPHGSAAAHVLGYVGRADPDPDAEPYHYYVPEMDGANGVELVYNARLTGEAGGRLLRVDASGYKHAEIGEREPVPGSDIVLTLDIRLQALAERVIAGRRGAVVVLDPRNGDVLAMASAPGFDPSQFSPALDPADWARLKSDPDKPFFNRAISGAYPPGSTFKPIVAFAALENGRAEPETVFDCPGYFEVGGVRFRCWRSAGHGRIAMVKALEQSCNAYFCQLGLQCEYPRIYHMADALGLGRRTGIDLPGEGTGLLPSNAWKRRTQGDSWRAGDTCNASIGQGALAFTPLQMAVATAAIANGGSVYRPRLRFEPGARGELVNAMRWSARALRTVRQGMYDVVQAPSGTGKRVRIEAAAMGGKTGTAEYGPRENRRKYTWMVVFAPFEAPRYAVAAVIEDAVSGGITVAPRLRVLMDGAFRLEAGLDPLPPEEEAADG